MIAASGLLPLRTRSVWATFIAFALILLVSLSARAAPNFPALDNQRIVDQAGLLTPATKADLELKLKGLEDATTDQVVVVTLNSLDGYEIEEYGYQLGRHWGIGQSGKVEASNGQNYKDNGILLIVAPNERKVRIEVGYGLEPVMTDALSSQIIRNIILPQFKAGNYEAGIVAGSDAIIEQLSLERGVAIQKAQAAQLQQAQGGGERMPAWVVILVILFVVFFARGWLPWFILGNVLGSGRGGDWGGGSGGGGWSGGGGGGFSGGGGSFGGGGSSGSW